jgi:predicted  nucleic acid-binding Zn-ribbon protein
MHKDVAALEVIQALEQRLKALDAEIASFPRKIAEIEARLSAHQQVLDKQKAVQATNQGERKALERQIQDFKIKIEKSRSHSAEVKTNHEYRALLDEIAFSEAEIRKCEDRMLQFMVEAETADRAVKSAELALQAERREVEAAKAEAQARTDVDRAEKAQLQAELATARADVAPELLRHYDRVARLRGSALSSIDNGTCATCRVRLRPQRMQEIAGNLERIFLCESCGRILVLHPPDLPESEVADAQVAHR